MYISILLDYEVLEESLSTCRRSTNLLSQLISAIHSWLGIINYRMPDLSPNPPTTAGRFPVAFEEATSSSEWHSPCMPCGHTRNLSCSELRRGVVMFIVLAPVFLVRLPAGEICQQTPEKLPTRLQPHRDSTKRIHDTTVTRVAPTSDSAVRC